MGELGEVFPCINNLISFQKQNIKYVIKQSSLSSWDKGLISACISKPHRHPVIVLIGDDYRTRSAFHRMSLLCSKTKRYCSGKAEKCKL